MRRATTRLLAQSPFPTGLDIVSTRSSLQCLCSRLISKTSRLSIDEAQKTPSTLPPLGSTTKPSDSQTTDASSIASSYHVTPKTSSLTDLATMFKKNQAQRSGLSRDPFLDSSSLSSIGSPFLPRENRSEESHHFHVYATKHNTHITLTKPNRDPIISVSAGNIGFRKSARKHYDSAFQLAGYVMGRIQEQGINPQIRKLEVTLRGFGAGREAVTKALLGNEGRFLRGKVVKVSDATRLKFGGTRSKKPRRLG